MIMEVLRALGRRWYVVLLGLALTVGLAYAATQVSPPEYNARALILLLPGSNAVAEGGNPFLALSGLEQPGSIVVAYFDSAGAKDEVAAISGSAQFEVALDASTRGPVIAVDVTDTSTTSTMAVLGALLERVPAELARLQAEVDAPSESVITSMPIVVDTTPELDYSGTVRLGIAGAVVGVAVTGLLAFTLDGLILRRAARRGGKPTTSAKHTKRSRGGRRGGGPAAAETHRDDDVQVDPVVDGPNVPVERIYPEPVRAGRAS